MGLVAVNERHQEKRAWKTPDGKCYTRAFEVELSAVSDGPHAAMEAAGIPGVYDAHPDNAASVCVRVQATPTVNRKIWHVRAEYETPTVGGGAANPLNADPVITWGFSVVTVAVEKDIEGEAILNSAGDPFARPAEKEIYIPYVQIDENVATFNAARAIEYMGTINESGILICGYYAEPKTAKVVEYSGRSAEFEGTEYWVQTIRIEFDESEWKLELADVGFYVTDGKGCKVDSEDNKARKIMVAGEPAVTPQRLDGSGGLLAWGAETQYRSWDVDTPKAFTNLGLPTTL